MPYADLWTWVVTYTDATQLAEYDPAGEEHSFAEVDLSRVATVQLVPTVEALPLHVLLIDPTLQRPIFFRRRQKLVDMEGQEQGSATIHVLGWQRTLEGRNVKSLVYYFEDGSSLVTDNDQAV